MNKTHALQRLHRYPPPARGHRPLGCILGALLVVGITPAESYAKPTVSVTSGVTLRYRREKLTSAAAATALLQRISDAALESCGASSFSLAEYKRATLLSRCWRVAVDGAVRSIDSPVLSAARNKGGR